MNTNTDALLLSILLVNKPQLAFWAPLKITILEPNKGTIGMYQVCEVKLLFFLDKIVCDYKPLCNMLV